jgi:oligoendopeptidase F
MKKQTTWNLALLYKSDDDPQIEKDMKIFEDACMIFEKKYKRSNVTTSAKSLHSALKNYYGTVRIPEGSKPWWYFALKTCLNSDDAKSEARATKYMQRITEANNKIKFFMLQIAAVSKKEQKVLLTSPVLNEYRYKLEKIFTNAKYNLSEAEEQLADLLEQTSYTMWADTQEKVLNQQSVNYKGVNVPLSKITAQLAELPKKDREIVHKKINSVLKSVSVGAGAEINAIYNYKKVMDERRGFSNPYSSRVLSCENDEKSVELLVALVTKHFPISHRFYKLQAKLLKEKKISPAHRAAPIGKIKTKFDLESSIEILQKAFQSIDPEYAAILNAFVTNGQVDVYPKQGKKGGAFCWGMRDLPTYILLNHTDTSRSLETFGHEMGHAIHTELSGSQPVQYDKYSTATAEVASTFFEQVVGEEMDTRLSEKERIFALHNRILRDITTIFRQVACFNFELELHTRIRAEGQVTEKEMAKLMNKHLKSYFGPSVTLTEDDGYGFVSWSHIRNFFYVYTYAYGQIISKSLFVKWKKDKEYAIKIKAFLKAGKSMSPEDIFRSIGIDTSKPEFFEAGLKSIEQDIITLEKLTSKK